MSTSTVSYITPTGLISCAKVYYASLWLCSTLVLLFLALGIMEISTVTTESWFVGRNQEDRITGVHSSIPVQCEDRALSAHMKAVWSQILQPLQSSV